MKLCTTILLAILAFAMPAAAHAGTERGYSYYEIGDLHAPRPAATHAGLLLAGGGDWPTDAFRCFARKAGGGHLVILAASGGAERGEEVYRDVGGLVSVQTIIFTNRRASFDPRVLAVLASADGIFIAGGDQANYVRFWKGTPVARANDRKIAIGKPVGGTSAGLAILGHAGYGAMDGGSIESPAALADPLGPAVTIVRDFLHMPFLKHVVTDTHFSARNRLGRLIAFVAQVRATSDRRAVGLGIDEDSALCVEADGSGRFYTRNKGFAWLVEPAGVPKLKKAKPLNYPSIRITRMDPNSRIDLKSLKVTNPASSIVVSIDRGRLSGI